MNERISVVTVLALLFNLGAAPSSAQETTILQGGQIIPGRLSEGAFVTVVYTDGKGKHTRASGYVKSVSADAFIIGKGFWQEMIEYSRVLLIELPGRALKSGSLVRVFSPAKTTGALISVNTDSLVLKDESGERVAVPRHRINKLEVFKGIENGTLDGAAVGLVSGFVIGGIAGLMILAPDFTFSSNDEEQFRRATLTFLLFTGGGLLIGAGIGSRIRKERWKRANADRLYLDANRSSKAIGLTASVRF